MNYPNPCYACEKADSSRCSGVSCGRWRMRYLCRQKQINAYARKIAGRVKVNTKAWVYMHPDEYKRYLATDPCEGCIAQQICDTPCEKRTAWWDANLEVVRRQLERDTKRY